MGKFKKITNSATGKSVVVETDEVQTVTGWEQLKLTLRDVSKILSLNTGHVVNVTRKNDDYYVMVPEGLYRVEDQEEYSDRLKPLIEKYGVCHKDQIADMSFVVWNGVEKHSLRIKVVLEFCNEYVYVVLTVVGANDKESVVHHVLEDKDSVVAEWIDSMVWEYAFAYVTRKGANVTYYPVSAVTGCCGVVNVC